MRREANQANQGSGGRRETGGALKRPARWVAGGLAVAVVLLGAASCGDDSGDGAASGVEAGVTGDGGEVDGGDGGAPIDPERRACEDYYRAIVERTEACGFVGRLDPRHKLCPDILFARGSAVTGERLEACLAALRERPCAESLEAIEACAFSGTVPPGGECLHDSQCQSGTCASGGPQRCGQCTTRLEIGSACSGGGSGIPTSCARGAVCRSDAGEPPTCKAVTPTPTLNVGDACSATPGPLRCPWEAPCLSSTLLSEAGTCQPLPKAGQPCLVHAEGSTPVCARFHRCAPSTESLFGVCVLIENPGALDSDCGGSSECSPELFCDFRRCAPRRAEGQPCRYNDQCEVNTFCFLEPDSQGRCVRARAAGESCAQGAIDGGAYNHPTCLDDGHCSISGSADSGLQSTCIPTMRGPGESCGGLYACVPPGVCGASGACELLACGAN